MNALLLIPQQLDRFILLPKGENSSELHFVRLETLVSLFIERTFPGYKVLGQGVFRIIRDSDIEVEEEAEDLVQLLKALEAPPPRVGYPLKIDASMPKSLRRLVIDEMEVDPRNVVIVEGLVGLAQTVQIVLTGRQSLSLNLSVPASRAYS